MAAFAIPALGTRWSAKEDMAHSSNMAEIVAIFEELRISQSLSISQPIVSFSNSWGAIQRIAVAPWQLYDITLLIRTAAYDVRLSPMPVTIQRISSHEGITKDDGANN